MRIMYVAPRFHTNQIPIVKGWLERGHEVLFLSQFSGESEDYTFHRPVVLGYSRIFEIAMSFYKKVKRGRLSVSREYEIRVKAGFPPVFSMKKLMDLFLPELVIVRERSIYNIVVYAYCKRKKVRCLLYNQSPLWDYSGRDRGIGHRLLIHFLPKKRITPVMGYKGAGRERTKNAFFVPFVIEPHASPDERPHFENNKIQVLCVGRYEERKNLIMLAEVMKELVSVYPAHMTIVGESVDREQEQYYKRLKSRVCELGLEKNVTLFRNFSQQEMYEEYKKADLFVLPSTRERASISQLEAMSCSVPVICSDTNGSACYVEHGKNGFLFRDNDAEDLKGKLKMALEERDRLLEMGKESYRLVMENYRFEQYYEKIMKIGEKVK